MANNHETTVTGASVTPPGQATKSGTGSPELVVFYPWGPSGPGEIGRVPEALRVDAEAILAGEERISLHLHQESQLNGMASEVAEILRAGPVPVSVRDGYTVPSDISARLARELSKMARSQVDPKIEAIRASNLHRVAMDAARARWFVQEEERSFDPMGALVSAAFGNPGKWQRLE